MDSIVVSHLLFPTDDSLDRTVDPNRAQNDPVETPGGGGKTKRYDRMVSFVVLLEKYGCVKKCDGQYMVSLTASKSWEALFKDAQFVGSVEFNRNAILEAAQVYPSVFVYIAQQLKGRSLFPNLSTIYLEGLDTSSHYLPLLSSTNLKNITLKLVLGIPFLELTIYAFLENLISASPGLQSLKLQNVAGITSQMLNAIVKFQHLHTLEIIRFGDVENLEQLRPLGTLASLKFLSLKVEHLTYARSTQPTSSDPFLPSLRRLRVEASLDVVSDFILFITSDQLENFTFHHIPTRAANIPQLKPRGTKKLGRSMVDDTPKEKADFLGNLASRWPQHLKEVAITSSTGLEIDLRDVSRLQALGRLEFNGASIISINETFKGQYGFRNSLQSLCLSRYHVSLSLLRTIALSAPFLREMTVSIDIGEQPTVSRIPAIIHPLQSLSIDEHRKSQPGDFWSSSPIDLSQLIFIAQYLNALFPNIQVLTASFREIEWGRVWQLLKFCQVSRDDEQGRKSIVESSDVK